MKNRSSKTLVVAAVLLGALSAASVVACGGSVENPTTQSQASAATKAPVAPQSHGMVKVIGEALGEVSLRGEQRTEIEQLAESAEQRHAGLTTGKKELMLVFADQVEKGSIDRAALQAKTDQLVTSFEKGRPDDVAALTRLHAILDADQRGDLVDALESRMKAKHGGHEENADGEHHRGGFHALKQLAVDMKLSDEQRGQIKDVMKANHDGLKGAHHAHMGEGKKAREAFREDSFDANAVAPAPDKIRQRVAEGGARFVTIAEKILPILTPEQRKIGADKIRQLANGGITLP